MLLKILYFFCHKDVKNRKCFTTQEERENHKKTIVSKILSSK